MTNTQMLPNWGEEAKKKKKKKQKKKIIMPAYNSYVFQSFPSDKIDGIDNCQLLKFEGKIK
ncbi:hypothetical protein PP707_08300 [Acetobacter pasteurianus]|nr:hypothetical protein [Acetobacter pasteurianus]